MPRRRVGWPSTFNLFCHDRCGKVVTGDPHVAKDIGELFRELDRSPSVASYLTAAKRFEELGHELRPIRLAQLSSFTIDPLIPFLKVEAARQGFRTEVYVAPFDSVRTELLDPNSGTVGHAGDAVFLTQLLEDSAPALATGFLELAPDDVERAIDGAIDDLAGPIRRFRESSATPVIAGNFVQRSFPLLGIHEAGVAATQTEAIRRLNSRLRDRLSALPGVHVLDFDRVCADVGYRRWRNPTGWYLGRAALTPEALRELARVQAAFLQAVLATPRKCLVLDLDNTLWGGVVGEDGAGGVQLGGGFPGNAFADFQRQVLELHRQGVILAINSKNNTEDAREVFRSRPEMVLGLEHFSSVRINWQDKARNMEEIAEELNIGLESMVFFDDNAAERELMRQFLPQVETLEVPESPVGYVPCLLGSRCFDKLSLTWEDRMRGELYQAQTRRGELRRSSRSLEEYYQGLDMVAEIEPLSALALGRAHDLIQKTNQLNMTVRRHSESALEEMAADPDTGVFTLKLADRFGDNGIVGLAIVRCQDATAVVDSFLLSCRVIGRTVETAFFAFLADWARDRGARRLLGEYVATSRNRPAVELYQQHGFERVESAGDRDFWQLDLSAVSFAWPPYIRLEKRRPARVGAESA